MQEVLAESTPLQIPFQSVLVRSLSIVLDFCRVRLPILLGLFVMILVSQLAPLALVVGLRAGSSTSLGSTVTEKAKLP